MSVSEAVAERVVQVLAEDRERPARIEFSGYQCSDEHKCRLAALPANLQIPRFQWAAHPNYKGRFQMPNFHHDFRQHLQAIIALLWDATTNGEAGAAAVLAEESKRRRNKSPEEAQPSSTSAATAGRAKSQKDRFGAILEVRGTFQKGLNKHVNIEESWIFPRIREVYASVNVTFLYDDHKDLLSLERSAYAAIQKAAAPDDSSLASKALELVVKFDKDFMNHLGEEEEYVTPFTLSSQGCLLHG